MSEKPWYHAGLKFECVGCGGCCTGAPGYVWINKAEIAAMADVMGMSVVRFERQYVRLVGIRKSLTEFSNGDCVLLDNPSGRCRVYRVRPRQCRTWPFWESNLCDPEAWEITAQECPGANQGLLIDLRQIQAQSKTIKV